jgi:hypothetical protein
MYEHGQKRDKVGYWEMYKQEVLGRTYDVYFLSYALLYKIWQNNIISFELWWHNRKYFICNMWVKSIKGLFKHFSLTFIYM